MKHPEEKGLQVPVPNSHQRRSGHFRLISLLAGLGALAVINVYFRGTEPTVYALCSPHGAANIYTVDANDTKVQCLIVEGERFLHTSTHGENVESPKLFENLTLASRVTGQTPWYSHQVSTA